MFNADPDAAALKRDETWCYIAVLIRRQAHTHICIQVLWHTAAVATMSNSSTHQSCCSYNLHRDGRKQEGTQLRIDAKPWERFRQIFHSFLINSKMNYPHAVTNQVASILQSSSAFKCLFIWCKVFFFVFNVCYVWTCAGSEKYTCLLLDILSSTLSREHMLDCHLPVGHSDMPPLFNNLTVGNHGVLACLEKEQHRVVTGR